MSEDGRMDASDDRTVTVKAVKLYDGSPGYMLPNGIVITPEALDKLGGEVLRDLMKRPPIPAPAIPTEDDEKPE